MRKLLSIFSIILTLCALSSCNHKELCYHHEHLQRIRVQFDWRFAPEAKPAGMYVFFYQEGADKAIRYSFDNAEGGYVSLPTGRYRMIAYNNDTEATQFDKHHQYDDHMAYTRKGHILEPVNGPASPEDVDGETVVISPDEIYVASAVDIDVTEDGVSYICVAWEDKNEYVGKPVICDEQLIILYPHDVLCHYSYEVRNVSGVERIDRLCGSLTGMSPSLQLASEELHTFPVTLPCEARIDPDGVIRGEFLTFGHHADNSDPHRMVFYLWLKNGKKYRIGATDPNYDVTNQVETAPNRRRVHLIIDGMNVPDEQEENPPSELDPSTDDWFEVNTEIYI